MFAIVSTCQIDAGATCLQLCPHVPYNPGCPSLPVMAGSSSGLAIVPVSKWQPRCRAPEVSLDDVVACMAQGLGTAKLLKVSQGQAAVVHGWDIFSKGNKMTDTILELNQDLLSTLNKLNPSGIWKKLSCRMLWRSWTSPWRLVWQFPSLKLGQNKVR